MWGNAVIWGMSDFEIAAKLAYTPDEEGLFTDEQLNRGRDMLVSGIAIPEEMVRQLAVRHAAEQAIARLEKEGDGFPPPSSE